jgi:6-phosphogluconolactonase
MLLSPLLAALPSMAPAQVPAIPAPELTQITGGWLGSELVFAASGLINLPPIPQGLLIDFALSPVPVPLGTLGELFLAATPALQFVPGDGSFVWAVDVPSAPVLVGLPVHVQALGFVFTGLFGDLKLSNLETVVIAELPPPSTRLLAVANLGDATVSMAAVDCEGNRSRHLGFQGGLGALRALAAGPDGTRLYTVDNSAGALHTLAIDLDDGDWEPLGAPVLTGAGPECLAVDPSGRFLYVGNAAGNTISQYRLDGTGTPQPLLPATVPGGLRPSGLTVDPSGRWLFALASGSGDLGVFRIDPASGTLSLHFAIPLEGAPTEVVVDRTSRHVYVLHQAFGVVTAWPFDPESGTLSPAVGAPVVVGFSAGGMALHPYDRFLYVLDAANSTVEHFAVHSGTGALSPSPIASVPTGEGPTALALDPGARRLYVVCSSANEVWIYEPSLGDGTPTLVQRLRCRTIPIDLAILSGSAPTDLRSRFLLAAHEHSNELRAYQVDVAQGKLIDLGGGTNATGPGARAAVFERRSGRVLTADALGGALSAFVLNVSNGNLSPLGASGPTVGPVDVAFDGSGRFAWSVEPSGHNLRSFELPPGGGVPLAGPTVSLPTALGPRALTLSPEGRHLLVAGAQSGTVDVFQVSPAGQLTPVGAAAVPGELQDVAVDPSGRMALVLSRSTARVHGLLLDPQTGAPMAAPIQPAITGAGPVALALHPGGRFAYTANATAKTITTLAYEPNTGAVFTLGHLAVADAPTDLIIDASGELLVAAEAGIDLLQVFRIDPLTGQLTGTSFALSGGDGPAGLGVSLELD